MLVSTYPYTAISSLKRLNMGFKAVYRALQDVFPQVDARLLKAVAIEHSKDADAAVEFVLSDVLPFMSHHPGSSGSSFENQLPEDSSLGRGEEESIPADHQHAVEEAEASNVGLSTKSGSVAGENPNDDEALDGSTALDFYDANDGHDGVYENTESEELIPLEQGQDTSSKVGPGRISNIIAITPLHADDGCDDLERALEKDKNEDLTLSQDFGGSGVKSVIDFLFQIAPQALIHEDDSMVNGLNDPHEDSKDLDLLVTSVKASSVTSSASMHGDGIISSLNDQHADSDNLNGPVACDFGTVTHKKGQEASGLDGGQDKMIQVHIPDTDAPECLLQAEIDSISCITHCEKQESSVAFDNDVKQEDSFDIEMVGDVVEPVLNTIVTQSGHICSTDFLEEMIEDAKNNKKTLFSSMDSVMNIMLEVELQEKAAQQAREEAARGGLEILTRVEELKEMLQHAKEANGMHAGEVYGEKAILATEARELQSRLLGLSDERDKSLKILDEMHHALEARLAAAEEEIEAAEQVKFEKEDSARKALAEQEAIMEEVVQESMMLKQEAEENSKLQEFLMDRGRIVDMLQGEISVICQDVKFLKEKFDQRVPLSQSLSSSQTSCKLASSSSSLKSMSSDSVPVPALADECETPKQTSPTASVSGQSPKKKPVENGARDDHKALLDDGWDLFENDVDI